VIYVENPDGTIRGVSPVEREAIERVFTRFKEAPTSVALSFANGNVVTYRKRES
jgi:hypothetical protein